MPRHQVRGHVKSVVNVDSELGGDSVSVVIISKEDRARELTAVMNRNIAFAFPKMLERNSRISEHLSRSKALHQLSLVLAIKCHWLAEPTVVEDRDESGMEGG